MFKKIVLSLLCVAAMVFGVANAENVVNPYELANSVASKVIDDIKANKDRLADKKVALSIINNDLMPYVDVKYAAYKVIGTSLKTTSPEDREKFTEAFAVYMQENFASVLSKYTNQQIVPAKVQEVDANTKLVSVKMLIREEGKKDLELILKFRKNSKTGEWKAFDLIGENISMLDAKISELSPVIKNSGIDAAIKKLQEISNK
ncbi:MAG: ABC transporter substrate-binding protein [Succinivibrio sp.]|nr:ABC transporter substrate-binding protein [Succinivibrio sp.]